MRHRCMKKLLIAVGVLVALFVAVAFFGVSTGSSDEKSVSADSDASIAGGRTSYDAPASTSSLKDGGAETEQGTALDKPALIRTGSIGLRSDKLERDLGVVRSIATELKGQIETESNSGGDHGGHYAELTLRVPNDQFDTAMKRLAAVADVTHREISSTDVTTEVIDIDARVRAQQASVASLEKLMAKANTVGEVMSVERELSQRQGELDSLLQQQRYLKSQTSMSTISVSMSTDRDLLTKDDGFVGGLKTGWQALTGFLVWLSTAAGMVLPFVPLLLIVAGIVVWVVRRRRRLS